MVHQTVSCSPGCPFACPDLFLPFDLNFPVKHIQSGKKIKDARQALIISLLAHFHSLAARIGQHQASGIQKIRLHLVRFLFEAQVPRMLSQRPCASCGVLETFNDDPAAPAQTVAFKLAAIWCCPGNSISSCAPNKLCQAQYLVRL